MRQLSRVGRREVGDGRWREFWACGRSQRRHHMLSPDCSCHANGLRNFNILTMCQLSPTPGRVLSVCVEV